MLVSEIIGKLESYEYDRILTGEWKQCPEKKRYFINNIVYILQNLCPICGSSFLSRRYQAIFCSRSCRNKGENNPRYGDHRSWKDLHGKEKSDLMCKEKSVRWIGNKNPNFGDNHWVFKKNIEEINSWKKKQSKPSPLKDMKFDEYYGDRANDIRKKISDGTKKNMPIMGAPPISCGYGFSGKYKGFYFRSSLELMFLCYLKENNIIFETAETEKYKISYINTNGDKKGYRPDFIVNGYVIEIKPQFKLTDHDTILKIESGKQKFGDKYKVYTEKTIEGLLGRKQFKINDIYDLYIIGDIEPTTRTLRSIEKYEAKINNRNNI